MYNIKQYNVYKTVKKTANINDLYIKKNMI